MERKFLIKGKWYKAHNKKEWIKLAHCFVRQIEPEMLTKEEFDFLLQKNYERYKQAINDF